MEDTTKFELEKYSNKKNITNHVKQIIKNIIYDFSKSHEGDINITIEDLKTILNHKGQVSAGFGEQKDIKSELDAMILMLKDASLNINSFDNISAVLISFVIPQKYPIAKIKEAMDVIYKNIQDDATVFFGTTTDNTLNQNHIKINGLFIVEKIVL